MESHTPNTQFKNFYNTVVPLFIRRKIGLFKQFGIIRLLRLRINTIKILEKELNEKYDVEKLEVLDFLKNHRLLLTPYPYHFPEKYNMKNVVVYKDNDCDMQYVLQDNKRLYFPKDWSAEKIKSMNNWLLLEQDIDSPHRYEYSDFQVKNGDIVVDCGVAEGNFALSIVEKAQKIYLFECDPKWIESLEKTFSPWKEKVVIVNKYVSDTNDNSCVRLDDFFDGKIINFLKADIEGAELSLLAGAMKILSSSKNLRIAICTYHKQNDAKEFNEILQGYGFITEYSKGYSLPRGTNACPPYLRRGLIRATKI